MLHLIERHSRRRLLDSVECGDDFKTRLVGLIGRRSLCERSGLYLPRCSSVHTCFMSLAIDIIYVDADWKVIRTVRGLKPWRMSFCRKAAGVIEAAEGWIDRERITTGMELRLEPHVQ